MTSTRARLVTLAVSAIALAASTPAAAQTPSLAFALVSPEEGGPRRWEVISPQATLLKEPFPGGQTIGDLGEGDVLTNLGCSADGDGPTWCTVRPFRGGARGYVAAEYLKPATGPDGVVPLGVNDTRKRARKNDFDEDGTVTCAQESGDAMASCRASVARQTGGDAAVVVTFPSGFKRMLFFAHGAFIRGNSTMSGVGTDIGWDFDGASHVIRVDDQRFVVPQNFVLGSAAE